VRPSRKGFRKKSHDGGVCENANKLPQAPNRLKIVSDSRTCRTTFGVDLPDRLRHTRAQ
jgi:hypothetical protein